MLVMLAGIETSVRLEQPENAELSILVTIPGMAKLPDLPPGYAMRAVWLLLNKTPSVLLKDGFKESTTIESSPPQDANAELPMLVILAGSVMLVRLLQYRNAELPMLVTLFGIVTLVTPSQR